ncbi:MAG: ABC transporter permease [Chloroflexi bacterium]|nr:ABC transporter permease [Chloroflexota bacterium]
MSGQPGSLPELRSPSLATTLVRELRGSYAFIERNLFLVKRYWGWEFAFLVYAVAGALSITFIGAELENQRLLLSLMIGAIFWNYLSIVFGFIAETVAWERWEGTLEYTFMAPVRRWVQLLGSTMFAVLYGLVHTAVILVVLTLFFGLDLSHADFGTAAVMMIIGSASFIGIGMMAAVLPLMYVERGAQMTFVLQSLLLLVSGVYYSIEVLPDWMQVISWFSPATYVLDGVRQGLIDGTPITALWHDVWPLVIMAVVLIPLGVWVFGQAERYAKRTGKLKRVG